MIALTTTRVHDHTAGDVNERIKRQTQRNVAAFGDAGPSAIDFRLQQLDREWDMERLLQTNFSLVALRAEYS